MWVKQLCNSGIQTVESIKMRVCVSYRQSSCTLFGFRAGAVSCDVVALGLCCIWCMVMQCRPQGQRKRVWSSERQDVMTKEITDCLRQATMWPGTQRLDWGKDQGVMHSTHYERYTQLNSVVNEESQNLRRSPPTFSFQNEKDFQGLNCVKITNCDSLDKICGSYNTTPKSSKKTFKNLSAGRYKISLDFVCQGLSVVCVRMYTSPFESWCCLYGCECRVVCR